MKQMLINFNPKSKPLTKTEVYDKPVNGNKSFTRNDFFLSGLMNVLLWLKQKLSNKA